MKKVTALVFAILAAACGASVPRVTPKPPTPQAPTSYTLFVHVCSGTPCESGNEPAKLPGARVSVNGDIGPADGAGNRVLEGVIGGSYRVCASFDGYLETCADKSTNDGPDLFLVLARDVPPIQVLRADGKIFRTADGQPWRWKGVSAFALLDRYARGEDISDLLVAYRGYNLLRVWPYVPRADWGDKAWDSPPPAVVVDFLRRVARDGWYVEITLLTDDDPARIPKARELVAALVAARPPNLLLEIANEPQAHKATDTRALKVTLDASGFLYASGDESAKAFGSYLTTHTSRDGEWPRRAHDLLELWTGGGPDAPTDPAHKVPAVADEPIRPDQAGYNVADFRAYFAACALMGAGATFHSETGKFGLPPTPAEATSAAAALDGLNAFPADAPLGPYRRPVESSLRTYAVGPYMVRVRPTTKDAPEAGWTAIDADGVLWRR